MVRDLDQGSVSAKAPSWAESERTYHTDLGTGLGALGNKLACIAAVLPATGLIWALLAPKSTKSPKLGSRGLPPGRSKKSKTGVKNSKILNFDSFGSVLDFFDPFFLVP